VRNKQLGFTLVELVISVTIISIALIGTLLAINTATLFSGDPMITQQGIAIGESYLEEILEKSFPLTHCPAPPSPGGRANFNNICQYNGLSESPSSQVGLPIAVSLNNYIVNVNVDTATVILGSLNPGNQVARVDVTVSHPSMPTMIFSAYRTNY
jgi:MSHA pilin protein MshD